MRILFISSIFPRPHSPNRGIYCLHWCKAMVEAGHDVRVISPRAWNERRTENGVLDGMTVEYPTYVYPPGVMRNSYGAFMWASARRAIRRALSEFAPDCVLSYWIHPDGEVAVRTARMAGVPSAVIVGGSDLLILPGQSAGRRRRVLDVLAASDAVITVGRDLRDRAVQLGVPPQKVHVVFQGVDGDAFVPGDAAAARRRLGIDESGKALLYVGNLLPVKGVDVLIDALAVLSGRGLDFRAYLVGDGALRAALEARSLAAGLSDRLRFVGAVVQRQLPDWYRAADVTVLSSRSEGIPNVLRESMACGTPFVATDVGGVHELAGHPANRLVPPANPRALADALAASLARGRPPVGELRGMTDTWQRSAERLLDVLRGLIAARQPLINHVGPVPEMVA